MTQAMDTGNSTAQTVLFGIIGSLATAGIIGALMFSISTSVTVARIDEHVSQINTDMSDVKIRVNSYDERLNELSGRLDQMNTAAQQPAAQPVRRRPR